MSFNSTAAALALFSLLAAGTSAASEPPGDQHQAPDEARDAAVPERRALSQSELGVTMRIIENPEALGSDAVTRRIVLPAPAAASNEGEAPDAALRGSETSERAREEGREFGVDASERGREISEQARERREDFGRSRAEEARPETPQPPPRPRPPGS
jgi:hypothetical protein